MSEFNHNTQGFAYFSHLTQCHNFFQILFELIPIPTQSITFYSMIIGTRYVFSYHRYMHLYVICVHLFLVQC